MINVSLYKPDGELFKEFKNCKLNSGNSMSLPESKNLTEVSFICNGVIYNISTPTLTVIVTEDIKEG